MLETALVLAAIAQKWQFRLTPGYPVETEPLVTLRPRNGIGMRFEERK
jgi:hypothetical protein